MLFESFQIPLIQEINVKKNNIRKDTPRYLEGNV